MAKHNLLSKLQQDSYCGASCFGGGKVRKGNYADEVTDSFLARELNELSVKERERAYEDVHGVAPIPEETPKLLEDAFMDLDVALAKSSRNKRKAYDRAIFLKPSLATDRKFHLMFLRADSYDAVKAALRMCHYFTSKLDLFGQENLVKKITLDDLNEDDMAAVKTGSIHIVPRKDSAGRAVMFFAQRYYKYKYLQNQLRYVWYVLMEALEDEGVQLNGVVMVQYCIDMVSAQQDFAQMITRAGPLLIALPFRIPGVHYCYNNARLRPALSLIQMIVGKHTRLRFRTHFGSNLEAQYMLMTFGIPVDAAHIRSNGSLKIEAVERHLAERRDKEAEWQKEEESSSATILYPSPKDVLLGRGRPYQDFSGNQVLAQIIDFHREQYQQASNRFDKTCLSLDVVKRIHERGGQFLQRIPNVGWEAVNDAAARDKVSHAFRTKQARPIKPAEILTADDDNDDDDDASSNNKRLRYDEDFLRRKNEMDDGV